MSLVEKGTQVWFRGRKKRILSGKVEFLGETVAAVRCEDGKVRTVLRKNLRTLQANFYVKV